MGLPSAEAQIFESAAKSSITASFCDVNSNFSY
jgi:hypothetical protein